jgi:hypothetical protein
MLHPSWNASQWYELKKLGIFFFADGMYPMMKIFKNTSDPKNK